MSVSLDRGSQTVRADACEAISVVRGPIAVVTLERPEKKNALTLAMWRALCEIVDDLGRDRSVRCVVLTGRETFCAGADIYEFPAVRSDRGQALIYEAAVQAALEAINVCSKPTIAAIRGYCIGGGLGIALACDFRFAGNGAVFAVPAAKLGIVYGVAECALLVAGVGVSRAKRILFAGARFGAREASRIGLAELVKDVDVLDAALAFAAELADNAPLSIAAMKLTLNAIAEPHVVARLDAITAATDAALDSEDYRNAIAAFNAKRAPVFQGL